jgi:hypothetical protein
MVRHLFIDTNNSPISFAFGYQGELMSQLELLSQTFGSVFFGTLSVVLLLKRKKPIKP